MNRKGKGRYCRICGCRKPNEKFSGKGWRECVCRECASMPKAEREAIEHRAEICGFVTQSNISSRNIERLCGLSASENPEIAHLAALVLEMGQAKSHKKKRLGFLAAKHPDLLARLDAAGLAELHMHY